MAAIRACLIALVAALAICTTQAGDTTDSTPWRAEIIRRLTGDAAPRWDADLPGYHLHSDIATVRLTRTRAAQPDAQEKTLVIAIHTPGKPHLEGLYLRTGGQNIRVSLRPDSESSVRDADRTTRRIAAGTYAVVTRRDDHMHIRLTPAFLALAAGNFEVHWVDYYR